MDGWMSTLPNAHKMQFAKAFNNLFWCGMPYDDGGHSLNLKDMFRMKERETNDGDIVKIEIDWRDANMRDGEREREGLF